MARLTAAQKAEAAKAAAAEAAKAKAGTNPGPGGVSASEIDELVLGTASGVGGEEGKSVSTSGGDSKGGNHPKEFSFRCCFSPHIPTGTTRLREHWGKDPTKFMVVVQRVVPGDTMRVVPRMNKVWKMWKDSWDKDAAANGIGDRWWHDYRPGQIPRPGMIAKLSVICTDGTHFPSKKRDEAGKIVRVSCLAAISALTRAGVNIEAITWEAALAELEAYKAKFATEAAAELEALGAATASSLSATIAERTRR